MEIKLKRQNVSERIIDVIKRLLFNSVYQLCIVRLLYRLKHSIQ